MSGIGSINPSIIGTSEGAKQTRKSKGSRQSKDAPQKASLTDSNAEVLAEISTSELVYLAEEALEARQPVRADLVEAVQKRLDEGHYEDRNILGRVAERLVRLFRENEPN